MTAAVTAVRAFVGDCSGDCSKGAFVGDCSKQCWNVATLFCMTGVLI